MFYDDKGRTITIKRELAQGGEGRLCTIYEDQTVLLKLLHQPTPEHAAKITAMLHKPPRNNGLAWPTSNVRDEHGRHSGHLIPFIKGGLHISQLYNPVSRKRIAPGFTYHYLAVSAANIARNTQSLHDLGYVIGDLNDANILVQRDGTVVVIDTDSIQVPRRDGRGYYRCTVGTEEYTPPELFGTTFAGIDRTKHHDNHSLAVLLFRTLMEGVHPFASRYHGPGDPPTLAQKVQQGLWPYDANNRFTPPPTAPPFTMLSPTVQSLFRRAFVDGHRHPARRPTAAEWNHELTRFHHSLRPCRTNKAHAYSNHVSRCPWCERDNRLRTNTSTLRAQPRPMTGAPSRAFGQPTTRSVASLTGTVHQRIIYRATGPDTYQAITPQTDHLMHLTVANCHAIIAHPNATPLLRAEALCNALATPIILREQEIDAIQQALPHWYKELANPELSTQERTRITQHIRRCEERLRTV